METLESFADRVLARTGKALNDMPVRHVASIAGGTMGHIFCARGNTYVCAVGYPSHVDDDGIEVFDTFEVVVIG